jgi:hypothetical protein
MLPPLVRPVVAATPLRTVPPIHARGAAFVRDWPLVLSSSQSRADGDWRLEDQDLERPRHCHHASLIMSKISSC